MIDDRAVERLGGAGEAAGGAAVAVAWCWVAARMIMSKDEAGASVHRRVGDDRAKREIGAALVARMAPHMETARLVVEVGDPQAFAGWIGIGEAAGEKCTRGAQAVQLQQILDVVVAAAVEESARNDPPVSPSAGTCYLVGETPTGSWLEYAGHLAAFSTAGWRFVAPIPGLAVLVKTTETIATYGSSGWEFGTVRASRLLIEGKQVVGSQSAPIADPAGGSTVDAEARAILELILSALRHHGLIASQ